MKKKLKKEVSRMEKEKIYILLIEDNPVDVRLIEEMINKLLNNPFNVVQAHTLTDGIQKFNQNKFQVVLLDLFLPDSNGLETLDIMLKKASKIPIIVIAEKDDQFLAIKAIKSGAQDYIFKQRLDRVFLERCIYYAIERYQKRLELENLAKILKFSETCLKNLIKKAPIAIFLLDKNGKILNTNEEAETLFEYSPDELLNLEIYMLFDPKSLEIAKKHYFEDLTNQLKNNKIKALTITKNEKKIYCDIRSSILKIGDEVLIQSFFSDITESNKYEKNRRLFLDKLITAFEFKFKFFSAVSHEFRTPLNAIIGFSELLIDEYYGDLNQGQKDFLNDIISAGQQLLGVVSTIIDISMIESGMFELNLHKVKFNNLISEISQNIEPLYSSKNIEYVVDISDDNGYIIVDPERFKQILYHLLDNAIKFTEQGSIKLRVRQNNDYWEFQIKDTGIGVAKKDYDLVFREFGRIENYISNQIPGVGLGLALTKRLIRLHNGKIWFESEIGAGSTFYFTIPRAPL